MGWRCDWGLAMVLPPLSLGLGWDSTSKTVGFPNILHTDRFSSDDHTSELVIWINLIKSISMTSLSVQGTCEWNFFLPVTSLNLFYLNPQSDNRKNEVFHDDVIKWKHFPRYWPFVRRTHRWSANSPHKGQWRGALMFSLICVWINVWVNNREAGDLRCHRAHYGVIVMYLHGVVWICRSLPASPMLYPIPPKPYIAVTALTWPIHGNDASDVAMAT